MTAIVFASQTNADAYAAAIDADMGYPRPGVNVGAGIHASTAEGSTLRHAENVKHPTQALWAYPFDPTVQAEAVSKVPVPATGTVQTLDATWTPAPVVVAAPAGDAEASAK